VKRLGIACGLLLAAAGALAQQLEPRAYSPAPVGLNIVAVPYLYSTGDVVTDPSLPVANVDAKINFIYPAYVHTFSLFGRQASASLALPYVWGKVSGDVMEERREVTRSGQGDMLVRLVTNLIGGPAMTPEEFARSKPRTSLGAASSSPCRPASTTERSSSTSERTAGPSGPRSGCRSRSAGRSSRPTPGPGSSPRTTISSAA
jgi:hypothetical protein